MTSILHISDTHLAADGVLVSGRLKTDVSFKKLLDRLVGAQEQWGKIDAVIVTGDISDDGSEQSYSRFKALVASLNLPIVVIPGNHDKREQMRSAFSHDGYLPSSGMLNWYRRIGDVNVIGLDTLVEGHGHGELSLETLEFLEQQLDVVQQQPLIVAMHHPPFETGIAFMDAIGLKNTDAFVKLLQRAQCQEIRILCGHIHSMTVASIAGHVVVSSPSPCSGFELDVRHDASVGFYDCEDGCLLHRWSNGFQTVRIGPNSGTGPHPFG